MKKIFSLLLISIVILSTTSCEKWLDVNTNPDSPTNVVASVASRLPWIQQSYGYAHGNASAMVATITGQLSTRYSNGAYADWTVGMGNGATSPYQRWFVGAASNIPDLIIKAEAEEAYHYIAAAKVLRAMGSILMADLYGEMPYTEAVGPYLTPKYDDGKIVYESSLVALDEAIVLFQKEQPALATPLAAGDDWNGGDVQKWIKLCYGLKARWMNNLSKKANYDMTAILAAIENGPKSNMESSIVHHVNDPSDMVGDPLVGDPMRTSYIFNVVAWGNSYRISQYYLDMMKNDPRMEKMVPSAQHYRDVVDPQDPTKYIKEAYFMRSKGVDAINTNIRANGGPLNPMFDVKTKKWNIKTENTARMADTLYCLMQSICGMQGSEDGESLKIAEDGTILSTGTFYSRPESPSDIMTYVEMCFIKAEVLLRQGNSAGAQVAYKDGVTAHIQHMNSKLKEYGVKSPNPDKRPMDEAAIAAFLSSNNIAQTAGEITMGEIMKQKFVAMSYTVQNWNDMRRFNYSAANIGGFGNVYPGYDRPNAFNATSSQSFPGGSPNDDTYWFRRIKHSSHEVNYNSAQLLISNPKALDHDVWSMPVWWDIAE